jgi:hypothetical protein
MEQLPQAVSHPEQRASELVIAPLMYVHDAVECILFGLAYCTIGQIEWIVSGSSKNTMHCCKVVTSLNGLIPKYTEDLNNEPHMTQFRDNKKKDWVVEEEDVQG